MTEYLGNEHGVFRFTMSFMLEYAGNRLTAIHHCGCPTRTLGSFAQDASASQAGNAMQRMPAAMGTTNPWVTTTHCRVTVRSRSWILFPHQL